MKKQNYLKGFLDDQSEFSHRCACWARNHMGWPKMKKAHKKTPPAPSAPRAGPCLASLIDLLARVVIPLAL